MIGWSDAAAFFSEMDPLGVIGSTLLDKLEEKPDCFRFKHHYMLHALDSQILLKLLTAMAEHRQVKLTNRNRRKPDCITYGFVIPLQIYVSTQSGRQYLLCYHCRWHELKFFRLDYILDAELLEIEPGYETYLQYAEKFKSHAWGISTGSGYSVDQIEMTVHHEDHEQHIPLRLEREKRNGNMERIGPNTCRYVADIYDAAEMLPWLRTFIGRIEKLECSNKAVVKQFYDDLAAMTAMYGGEC